MPTQDKIETVADLRQRLDGVKTVMLTEYRGLTVAQLSELRKQLRAVRAEYKVVKNRLARLAGAELGFEALRPHLKGPTALVIAKDDPVAVAKTLTTFAKTNQALAIKVAVVDGQLVTPDGIKALSDLPSREVLRAQIVGLIQGPLTQLVTILAATQRELAYILDQRGRSAPPDQAAAAE